MRHSTTTETPEAEKGRIITKIHGFVFNRHVKVLHLIVKWSKNFNFQTGLLFFVPSYDWLLLILLLCSLFFMCGLNRRAGRRDRKRELPWKEYRE